MGGRPVYQRGECRRKAAGAGRGRLSRRISELPDWNAYGNRMEGGHTI